MKCKKCEKKFIKKHSRQLYCKRCAPGNKKCKCGKPILDSTKRCIKCFYIKTKYGSGIGRSIKMKEKKERIKNSH